MPKGSDFEDDFFVETLGDDAEIVRGFYSHFWLDPGKLEGISWEEIHVVTEDNEFWPTFAGASVGKGLKIEVRLFKTLQEPVVFFDCKVQSFWNLIKLL